MYSDISNLTNSIPIIFASCVVISVLPTPVGPANRNEPIVLLSSLSPARDNLIALTKLLIAVSCPNITVFRSDSSFFKFMDSCLEIVCSGIFEILEIVFSISTSLTVIFLESCLEIFSKAPVSSIKSIALSGKNLSLRNLLDSVTAEFIDSFEYFTL